MIYLENKNELERVREENPTEPILVKATEPSARTLLYLPSNHHPIALKANVSQDFQKMVSPPSPPKKKKRKRRR